jgi:2-polyprenyl-3-methyl-5-hydroxy-6-metoxy-1,4-benzoquinol methylase
VDDRKLLKLASSQYLKTQIEHLFSNAALCCKLMSRTLLACWLALQTLAWCQDTHPVTGRQSAPVMGMGGAPWLVRPEREAEEAPDAALDAIGIGKGAIVADIGAGVGYFTWRLTERIGPTGKVYAVDIQPGMLERLRHNMSARHLTNYEAVLSAEDDPRLPPSRIDLALLVDVYHEFSQPRKLLEHATERPASLSSDPNSG